MNTLKYKGYIGSVAYSEPDKVFFGKIEGIDSLVNYEGESVKELISAFEEAVDDYLIFCEEHDVKPEKSYSGTFNVRIAPMVHREIANRAAELGITINSFVKKVLADAVSQPSGVKSYQVDTSDSHSPEPIMLMEPRPKVKTKERTDITFSIPSADAEFVRELAKRFNWKEI